MERWRRVIGHDGYFLADLRLLTPEQGGRSRVLQTGYRAVWWLTGPAGEAFLSAGPIDLVDDRISLRPGETARIAIRPMHPPVWHEVRPGSVLHLRERRRQTLGLASVLDRVGVPDRSRLLDDVVQRVGEVHLARDVEQSEWPRLHD